MESKRTRAIVVVVVVAILIALFFIFRGGEDSDSTQTTPTVPTMSTTPTTGEPSANDPGRAETRPESRPKPEPRIPEIEVVDGAPKGGPADLEFVRGEQVKFVVRSDLAEEIHVHGYDVTAEIPAGGKAVVEFPAELEGIFEVELHGSGALIAELTVRP